MRNLTLDAVYDMVDSLSERKRPCDINDVLNYKVWSKKIESLHYYYEQDIDYILEQGHKFDDLFKSINGQHPPILKMFLSKKINFETVLILDEILSFTKQLNKNINEKVLWPKLFDRMKRYRPFLSYNITKYKISLRDKLKEI